MAAEHPIILTVTREQDQLVFDMSELDSLIPKVTLSFEEAIFQQINDELLQFAQNQISANESTDHQADLNANNHRIHITSLGRVVFDQLLPNKIRKALKRHERKELFLRLDDRLLHLPWELAHDGEQFLCGRFRIGRQIITLRQFENDARDHSVPPRPRMLIICDPRQNLSAAAREAEAIAEWLDRHSDIAVEIIGGTQATRLAILQAFADFDIVHFAGHSQYDPNDPTCSGWDLADGLLTPVIIQKISNPPQLLFSNSCASARVAGAPRLNHGRVVVELGLGGSFLLAGVHNYIGALWPISDKAGKTFAQCFYTQLIRGKSIGEALYLTRKRHLSQEKQDARQYHEDALAYVHYGRPDDVLIDQKTAPQTSRQPAASPINRRMPQQQSINPRSWAKRPNVFVFAVGMTVLIGMIYFLVNRQPYGLSASYRQAVTEYENGHIPLAITRFQQLIDHPQNSQPAFGYGDLAQIYLEAELEKKATNILQQALSLPTINTMAYVRHGDFLFQHRQYASAAAAYQKALEVDNGLDSQWAEAANALGVLAWLDANANLAIDWFEKGLGREPHNPHLFMNAAYARYSTDDFDQLPERYFIANGIQDEAAPFMAQYAEREATKIDHTAADRPNITIGPFWLKGGTIKRLDYSWLISHLITDNLQNGKALRSAQVTPIAYADLPESFQQVDFDPLVNPGFMTFLSSRHTGLAVFGKMRPFPHVAYIHVWALKIPEGHLLLNRSFQVNAPDYLVNIATIISSDVVEIVKSMDR